MNASEKFNTAKKLAQTMAQIKVLNAEKDALSKKLADYVAETGDKLFAWPGAGIRLTYVSGSPAKETVDAKVFMELARNYMTAADYAACVAQATKMGNPRKPSFR